MCNKSLTLKITPKEQNQEFPVSCPCLEGAFLPFHLHTSHLSSSPPQSPPNNTQIVNNAHTITFTAGLFNYENKNYIYMIWWFSSSFDFVVPVTVASTVPQLTHFSRSEAQHSTNPILVTKRAKFNIYNPFTNKKNKRCFPIDDELSNEKINIFFFFLLMLLVWGKIHKW